MVDRTKSLNLHIPLTATASSSGTGNQSLVQTQHQLKIVERQQVTMLPVTGITQFNNWLNPSLLSH